jgi:hypothetical protein
MCCPAETLCVANNEKEGHNCFIAKSIDTQEANTEEGLA